VEDNYKERQEVFSKKIKAGKRRTYFFDVKETKGNDFYLVITESKKRFDSDQYERHKIFLYKEDFNKFIRAMEETIDYVKKELLPDYDFDAFEHNDAEDTGYTYAERTNISTESASPVDMPEEISEDISSEPEEDTTTPQADPVVENKSTSIPEVKHDEDETW